jgi:4-hydroxy-tetrahydrodipicolinate synthase
MSYQPLTDDDVFELFRTVTEHTELPVIVYDNPGTTQFTFSTDLYARIARLPGIASIKIPGVSSDPDAASVSWHRHRDPHTSGGRIKTTSVEPTDQLEMRKPELLLVFS